MPQLTIEFSEQDFIDLEAAAKFMQCGCRAEDAIKMAIRRTLADFRNERVRRLNMENAEKELETAIMAYVRSDVKEYFASHVPVNMSV